MLTIVHLCSYKVLLILSNRQCFRWEKLKKEYLQLISIILILFLIVSPFIAYAIQTRTIQIDALSKSYLIVNLTKGQSFSGSLSIEGGSDMHFYVTDPSGETVLGLFEVSNGREFIFTAEKDGVYRLTFDNSISSINQKIVNFSYSFSAPLILSFELIILDPSTAYLETI